MVFILRKELVLNLTQSQMKDFELLCPEGPTGEVRPTRIAFHRKGSRRKALATERTNS
jgi:hypothetical protein